MNSRQQCQQDVSADLPVQLPAPVPAGEATAPAGPGRAHGMALARSIQDIRVDRSTRGSLVAQIVGQIEALIASEALQPMEKLPSVRGLVRQLGVSAFTIVEAYDRLVSTGFVTSRKGAGYYVVPQQAARPAAPAEGPAAACGPDFDGAEGARSDLASAWLPPDWFDLKWLHDCARVALRSEAPFRQGPPQLLGHPDLRRQICRRLRQLSIDIDESQVLLVRNATHAIDLLLRTLTRPGDQVLVEDPTQPGLLPLLAQHGCSGLFVRRSEAGLDLQAMAQLAARHQPRLAFVTTVLHNPLGTTLSAPQGFQLLTLSEQFDFHIVEDDVFRELGDPRDLSLAALDGLRRVIRIDSTSKILPPLARIGSIVAAPPLIAELARLKSVSGIASFELSEKLALHALSSSEYRRHVARVRARLDQAGAATLQAFAALGLEPLAIPHGGPFVCAHLPPGRYDGGRIAAAARLHGVQLAPSTLFTPHSAPGVPWFRFNVSYACEPGAIDFFQSLQETAAP